MKSNHKHHSPCKPSTISIFNEVKVAPTQQNVTVEVTQKDNSKDGCTSCFQALIKAFKR